MTFSQSAGASADLGRRIGSGTFGTVYEWSRDPQRCAIKLYHKPGNSSPHATLVREWALMAAMRGRFNSLPCFQFSTSQAYYVLMPRGFSLWPHSLVRISREQCLFSEQRKASRYSKQKGLLLSTLQNCAFDLFTQLLGTLYVAGVEHRDIKPNNVVAMVDKQSNNSSSSGDETDRHLAPASIDERCDRWSFHLIDYGAAKYASCYPTNYVTTHIYRAPEKLIFQTSLCEPHTFPTAPTAERMPRFSSVAALDGSIQTVVCAPFMKMRWSERVDVWAMGVLLYEFATGQHFIPADVWDCEAEEAEDDEETERISGGISDGGRASNDTPSRLMVEQRILDYLESDKGAWEQRLRAIFLPCTQLNQFIELLKQCLQPDPEKRASLHWCWNHEFVQGALAKEKEVADKISLVRRHRQRKKLLALFRDPTLMSIERFFTRFSLETLSALKYLFDVGCDVGLRCHTVFAGARLLQRYYSRSVASAAAAATAKLFNEQDAWKTIALICLRLVSKMTGDNGPHRPEARQRAPLLLYSTKESPRVDQERALFNILLPYICDSIANNLWTRFEEADRFDRERDQGKTNALARKEQQRLVTPQLAFEMRDDPHSLFCCLRRACLEPMFWNEPLFAVVESVRWATKQ